MDLLNRFIELSETHGFEILFLNFPVTGLTEKDRARYNMLYQYCDEAGIWYVDYNKIFYRDFAPEEDFADSGHLNTKGAEKLTADLCERCGSWLKDRIFGKDG